jgi:hypothetical protein
MQIRDVAKEAFAFTLAFEVAADLRDEGATKALRDLADKSEGVSKVSADETSPSVRIAEDETEPAPPRNAQPRVEKD